MTIPRTALTERYVDAIRYAAAAHANQVRKGTDVPYIAHLLGVSSLVLEAGGDEDQAIAGLLHDTGEDCGGEPRLADVRARFGPDVEAIVRGCSDSLDEEWKRVTPWQVRKQLYLDRIAVESDRIVVVSVADKVHNGRAIVTDLQITGADVMAKFTEPTLVVWYYREVLGIAVDREVPRELVDPLRTAVDQIEALLG